ncbi:MAG: DUF4011 domain-containing protein [Ekhidna sp.]|nr:DUF4011 domain-containing protein [Ekhidna sp.]
MQKVLKSYLRRLSNLSGNNRSLLLLRLPKEQLIDVHDFHYAGSKSSFTILQQLISQQKKIVLCEEIDSRNKTSNELSNRLKKIQRIEKFIFEERGAKDLYVGWPFIKGKFSDDSIIRCPLMFIPAAIQKENNQWFLERRSEVNITFNKTFLLAYSHYNNIPVDENLVETVIDEYDKESTVFRTQLYELLKKSGVEIDFNRDNFSDELHLFDTKTKSQLELEEKTGRLKLYPQAVLGIFPQSGSYLVPDYVKLIESRQFEALEDFFLNKTNNQNRNQLALFDRLNEENTFTPFSLDAYQEHALKEIKKGNSLVVQGPPGTGKSQLISNLICDFIARGKNVLLVCQKKAALDVVYSRLMEKEMHDFVALVHDFKNDRKPIYEQINRQIESIEVYKKKNNSLDSIQLERGFLQASRRIDQIVEEMEEYREALFDEKECGKSIKELYLTSSPDMPNFSMNLEYRSFHFSTMEETQRKFMRYLHYFEKFEKKSHFWSKGPSFAQFISRDLVDMLKILTEISTFDQKILNKLKSFSPSSIDFDTSHYLSGKLPELKSLAQGLKENVVFKVYKQLHEDLPTKDLNWLTQTERVMMSCFRGSGVESTIPSDQLGRFQEVLRSATKARKNLFSWVKWRLFSKEKIFLKRVLVANELKSNKQGFNTIANLIDNRLNFEHSASLINENPWLHNFPKSFRKIDLQDWFYWQKMGLNMYSVAQTVRPLNDLTPISKKDHSAYTEGLKAVIKLIEEVSKKLRIWGKYVNIHQVRALMLGKEDPKQSGRILKKDFDALCTYHKLKDSLTSEERKVLDEMTSISNTGQEAITIFNNSIALAWINHIESKYPNLRDVSSGRLDELAEELRDQIESKRSASKEILLLKSREKTYEGVEYNRLKNRITYRDLQHQVTKKRRIWPIRKVINEFSDELFTLLPCWMCSPESASAIFPMQESFDLVIFDEASQCFVERGIPAMYRGKQMVITGDSMQLQPSELYRVRWEDADDDSPELEIDSLLDLTKHYLPEVTLSGHYRSKSLELIDFSNKHFYGGKLRLLPDYDYVNKSDPAINFIKVKGKWEAGFNVPEADTIVKLALDFLKNHSEKSIGIVTFNYRQQEYILDLLEEESIKKNITIPSSLFVKNIENVQGDERDIILFSITYAPDEHKKIRLQFGSLNLEGGENRLNVAVTRAREKIIVVSSILPQELKTDDTKNEGPKLLKKYLEYAWSVANQKWTPHIPEFEEHHVNWYLRMKLEKLKFEEIKDYAISRELPFADLAVKIKDVYSGLVLTDDERYFHALSPKQIYGFQHFHLTMKHWPHIRFHSREYWLDQEETKRKLRNFVKVNLPGRYRNHQGFIKP